MSAAHHPAVIQAYTQHCEKNKIPLRVRPDHTCTNECPLLELRGPFPVFVCKDSCRIHDCGERCTAYIAAKNNEGYVCPLTGRCIDKPMLIHYLGPPRTDGKGYKHDNYVRMGRGVYTTKDNIAKRAALQKHAAAQKAVRETFCDIMFGKTRHRMYSAAKERVVNEMAKHLRQHKHAAVPIQEHIETLHTLVQKTGAALNPPAPKLDRAATERMCDAVFEYYKKIASLSGKSLPVTKRNAEVFTACICQRLSTGHAINGCTVSRVAVPPRQNKRKHTHQSQSCC